MTPESCFWHKLGRGVSGVCQMTSSFSGLAWPGRLHVPLPARLPLCQVSLHHHMGGLERGRWHNSEAQGSEAAALRPGASTWCRSSCPLGLCERVGVSGTGYDWGGGKRYVAPSGQPRWPFLLLLFFHGRNLTLGVPVPRAGQQSSLHPAAVPPRLWFHL